MRCALDQSLATTRLPVDSREQMYLWPLPFALWSLLINARSAIAIKGQIKALPGSAEQ